MADIGTNPWAWSTTEGSNSPAGATTIGTGLDDNLRAIQAAVKALFTPLSSVAGTNTITATAVNVTAYAAGQKFLLIPAGTNTGATTINISSLGAKNIFTGGAALVGGELIASTPYEIEYDGTQFNILGSILKSGAVDLSQGSMVGVKFDATQNASSDANTLDDYAEGTWTPVIGATGNTPTITYTTQTGTYVKIGKLVFVQGYLEITANSGGTGNARITGLPFTSASAATPYGAMAIAQHGVVNLSAGYTQYGMFVVNNSTLMAVRESGDNVAAQDVAIGAIGATFLLIFSGAYIAST